MTENKPVFSFEDLHSVLNHRKTKALFKETCKPDDVPLMTLGRRPKGDLVVLRDLFIEHVTEDPTELVFAEKVFGDYSFWENLSKATWIQPYLREWRKVTDTKRESIAFKALMEEVQGNGRNAYGAAKLIVEMANKKDNKKPEAPSKPTDNAARRDAARLSQFVVKK